LREIGWCWAEGRLSSARVKKKEGSGRGSASGGFTDQGPRKSMFFGLAVTSWPSLEPCTCPQEQPGMEGGSAWFFFLGGDFQGITELDLL
jgi:hypothetical protein